MKAIILAASLILTSAACASQASQDQAQECLFAGRDADIAAWDAQILRELVEGDDQAQAKQYLEDLELDEFCTGVIANKYGIKLD